MIRHNDSEGPVRLPSIETTGSPPPSESASGNSVVESRMTAFFSRRGIGVANRKPTVPIRVGHVYLDAHRRTIYCLNDTARELLHEGVPLDGAIPATSTLRTLDGEPVPANELPITRAWSERRPCEGTFLLAGSDGVARHLTWNASPLGDAQGNVRGILASLVLTPFEPDWQQLAGLSHDLRTPLQALRLLMPLVENASLPPETCSILERIRACVERTLSIGLDLLEWTRAPTRGGRKVERIWFALEPILTSLANEHTLRAQEKGIGWRIDVRATQGVEICCDRVRMERLLSNLLSNAIRYTARGEVSLQASWRGEPGGSNSLLVLSVEDTGSGISPEDQESIFQPFERGRSAKDSGSDGSGMGLAVVDRLVEELGLTMEVFSEYGRGSRFEILLPSESVRRLPPVHK
jgi:signal transduction histidine kinase